MDCWTCEATAVGCCRFCGRGVCREHTRTSPFVLAAYAGENGEVMHALVVDDALNCGTCKPRPAPVDINLY